MKNVSQRSFLDGTTQYKSIAVVTMIFTRTLMNRTMKTFGPKMGGGFIAALVLVSAASVAHAQFSLGDAVNWAVLAEGSGNHNFQISNSQITGNVGIGNENGGNMAVAFSSGTVNGNFYFANSTANYTGGGTLNGTYNNTSDAQVDTNLNYLNNLSSTLGTESGTSLTINPGGSGSTQTLAANTGKLDGDGNYVFTLTSVNFSANTTLLINGAGLGGDSVVINVPLSVGNVSMNGAITLENGLTANQVLINVFGGNDVTLTGGTTVEPSANNAYQYVTYLDPDGKIQPNSINLVGHIYGGDTQDFQLNSGANVMVLVPEPKSVALGIMGGLVGLLVLQHRRFPKRNA